MQNVLLVCFGFLITVCGFNTSYGASLHCADYLSREGVFINPQVALQRDSVLELNSVRYTKNSLEYLDLNGLIFRADLTLNGEISFSIHLNSGGFRSLLSGSKLFDRSIHYFEKVLGKQINEIHTHWAYGDNKATFEQLRSRGVDTFEAAFKTWTGKKALQHGFSEISYYSTEMSHGNMVYIFHFSKPGRY